MRLRFVAWVKCQIASHRVFKVLCVDPLLLIAAPAAGCEFFFVGWILTFDFELRSQRLDSNRGSPDPARKTFSAFYFNHCPRRTILFDAAAQRRIPGREEVPVGRRLENRTLARHDMPRLRKG